MIIISVEVITEIARMNEMLLFKNTYKKKRGWARRDIWRKYERYSG